MLLFDHGLRAEVMGFEDGVYTLRFLSTEDFETLLYRIGDMPLPPYIKRGEGKETPCDDRTSYQTIYASQKGAVAAPTAGLHFSGDLFDKLKSKGIRVAEITLHVGYGTFLPVRVSDIREHKMHSEFFSISGKTADLINHAKKEGRRIVAVGTTTVRTLEYASDTDGHIVAGTGNCDLFIYPGYQFKAVDAMITNFHLPKSTLLMLVSALAGRTGILNAYQEAIRNKYRFYSYGDAMLII
ncbi:MAG: tRNA preQ1(34) S-adenosylmethionine ribosyltransferase-isomerase QueA, partial [Deltaproteobacteria bacterium]|nr:tRNA preQ1(34) S-adenosylmethionine ribosyltransferase-isomerase QueA [Deltaproteobacteria bacterium]